MVLLFAGQADSPPLTGSLLENDLCFQSAFIITVPYPKRVSVGRTFDRDAIKLAFEAEDRPELP